MGVLISSLLNQRIALHRGVQGGLNLLDRFGAVNLSPDAVGIDSDEARWKRVVGFQLVDVREVFLSTAIDREIDKLRGALPPVPGRGWLVDQFSDLVRSCASRVFGATEASDQQRQIVSTIHYRGRMGRRKELRPGIAAATILTLVPEASDCIIQMMQFRGIAADHSSPRADNQL